MTLGLPAWQLGPPAAGRRLANFRPAFIYRFSFLFCPRILVRLKLTIPQFFRVFYGLLYRIVLYSCDYGRSIY